MSGLKGTFFDSFSIPSQESEENKPLKEDGSDDLDSETGLAAEQMDYSDEEEEEYEDDESLDADEEEETNEEEEEDNQYDDSSDEVDDLDDEPLAGVINVLADEGVLTYDPNKQYSSGADGFREVVEETVELHKNKWIEEIPEDYRSIINHLKTGKPLDEWVANKVTPDFMEADLEDVDTQKALISRHLTAMGMDEEDIEAEIEKSEDIDDLERRAKVAQKYLVKEKNKADAVYEQQLKEDAKRREKEAADAEEYLRETIFETTQLGGFKLNKQKQTELYNHITKPVTKDGKTKLMLNQSDPKKQLLMAYMDMLDFDFKDVETKAATKVSKGLNKALSRVTQTQAKRTGGMGVRENKQSARIPKGIWDTNRDIED